MEDHINVAIRVRPLNQREQRSSATVTAPWHFQRDTITQRAHADGRPVNGNSFTFDKVFDPKDTTRQVYDDIVKNIITSSMGGFNGTIFAYGQTSSGKTHTMHGSGNELGIIKLAVKEIFDTVQNDLTREYLIRVSFLEIYNEVLRDLLEPTKTNLKIHENAKREIFVGDLSEHIVFNADQVEELLQKGDRNRHVAGTNMNERSSRSHTIFRIVIESREKVEGDCDGENGLAKRQQRLSTGSFADSEEFTGAVMVSCLNLVDLAGSERVGQTGAEGQRLKEGAHINKSLLALGTVIARLSEDSDRGHIPYRDSRLTRILQPSLGGNAKTLIICTITPSPDYIDEALSTLKFASRAKTIRNTPEVNQELRGDALLRRLKRASELEKEIAQMKEIERKKIKIEADNEALLRQLWKSQKERERLQRELEMQQSNVFLPRAPEDAAAVRRQTWFPGLQGPLSENTTAPESGDAAPMDTDAGDVCPELYQAPVAQPSELNAELNRDNQEKQLMLDQIMREYKLLLTTLTQLAEADVIPPSPVRPGGEAQPRELVQIRRKIRALMTTIEASQKQCRKFRSQRPEAEFLELELQAVQETLADKEEELVEMMRESDEVYSRLREAEEKCASAEQMCQDLRGELEDTEKAKAADAQIQQDMCTAQERQNQALLSEMAAIEQQMESERTALESKTVQLQQESQLLRSQLKQREQAAQSDIKSARDTIAQTQIQCQDLEVQLAAATSHAAELANESKLMAFAHDQAEALAKQEAERFVDEISQLQQTSAAQKSDIAALNAQLDSINEAASEQTRNVEQSAEKMSELLADIDGLQQQIAKSESDNRELVDSHAAQMREILEQSMQKEAGFKLQLTDQQSQAEEIQSQMSAQLAAYEDSRLQLAASLDKLREELELANNERSRMQTLVVQLESQNADVWEHVSELKVANGELRTSVALAEEVAAKQTARIDVLERDAIEATQTSKALQQDIDNMVEQHNTAIAEADAKASELLVNLDSSAQELARLRAELQESQGLRDTAANEAAQLELRTAELTSELGDTQTQLGQSQEALDKLRIYNTALQQAQAQLDQQMTNTVQQLNEACSREQQAIKQVRQLESSLEATQVRLQSLQQDMAETDQSKSAVAMLNNQLTLDLQAKSTMVAELEAQINTLNDSLRIAQQEAADEQLKYVSEVEHWEEQSVTSKAQIDELRTVVDQHEANTLRLKDQIASELQPRIDTLEAGLQTAQQTNASNAQEHSAKEAGLHADIEQLQRQVEDQKASMHESEQAASETQQTLQEQLADLYSIQQQTSEALETVGMAKQAAEERLAVVKDEFEQQLRDTQSRLSAADHERQRLEDALTELTDKYSSATAEGSTLSALTNSLRTELSAKTVELQTVQEELAAQLCQAKVAASEASESRAVVEAEAKQLRQALEEKRIAYLDLEAQVSSVSQMRDDTLRDLEEVQQALKSAQAVQDQSAERTAALEAEAAQMAEETQSLLLARDQLQASYDALTERTRGAQEELEQALAAANNELSSKNIALSDFEIALDKANAAADTARIEIRSQGNTEIERLEATVASLESQLAESIDAVDGLVVERDRAHASIDTLKEMMTELAQVKDDEIAGAEQRLEQHQALLESSVSEGLQKDEFIQQLEAAQSRLSEQVAAAETARDEGLSQSLSEVKAVQAELESARADIDRLTTEIAQRNLEAAAVDSSHLEQESEHLRALNDKLEKKNAKLRDVYKADISALHAEEEKQRLRAEALATDLATNSQNTQALSVQLEKVRQELAAHMDRAKAAVTIKTPETAPADQVRLATTRLASQLTPIKTDNKRLQVARSPATMLSPVPASKLNARVLEDAENTGCPPRKRAVVDLDNSADSKEASRARSSYGDRRRTRRNQPPSRVAGGLEEQTAEQCVQQ
ncbi:hypothetical protein GGH96_003881 [Coemansia sp. RSA 1972]|nr:hypothetical protein GGH96_003881 [Coemansia sp. RSA 1972]